MATFLPMRSVPSLGVRMQPRIDSSVVLPLPEGPISSVSSPGMSSRLTPFKALTSAAPLPSTLTMLLASRMGSIDLQSPYRLKTTAGSMRITLKMALTAASTHMAIVNTNRPQTRLNVMTIGRMSRRK